LWSAHPTLSLDPPSFIACRPAAAIDRAGMCEGRDGRPGLDQMFKDASRRKFDVVMAWAIDRLGRSLIELSGTIQTLEASGVDLYLDQQSIDTTTPAGKLMFQVCGAFGEFERSMIRQRIKADLKRAKAHGKQLGRLRHHRKTHPGAIAWRQRHREGFPRAWRWQRDRSACSAGDDRPFRRRSRVRRMAR
jgi:DNA invertase Pin-like site-specific DNA recombinase